MRSGWSNATLRPLYPQERRSTHCTGGWVGPRAGLDRCENSPPPPAHNYSITGPSSPWRVSIPTELSQPTILNRSFCNLQGRRFRCSGYEAYRFVRDITTFRTNLLSPSLRVSCAQKTGAGCPSGKPLNTGQTEWRHTYDDTDTRKRSYKP